MIFETYHTIPNVNESNNKFCFDKDDAEITIPEGSYEVRDINEFLKGAILRSRRDTLETVDLMLLRGDNSNNINYNIDDDDDDGEDQCSQMGRIICACVIQSHGDWLYTTVCNDVCLQEVIGAEMWRAPD
ncbi:hypothetical protein ALC60_12382 [Trachymyrmex zeteki]|uniref:Uncharacterized protein n=1 Tax=Mycetomoellerius zeteki TaxID=64791 RepID=A0A151WL09_9HYME|nr:hypothetical protein ALC60_12382 [Trachymyrmex zeteki]